MSIFKIIKNSIIILCIIIISVMIVFIYNIYHSDTVNKNIENNITNSDKIVLNMDDDVIMVLYEVAKKNGNWSNLPLSNNFKKKYNSKDGIFKGDNYTYCSTKEDSSFDKTNHIVCYNIEHNYKNEWYYVHYTINDNNELDDVEIVDKILRYDENGEEVIYKETMDGAFVSNIILLAAPGRLEYDPFDYIYVTDRYLNKWSDGFIDYDISCGIENVQELDDKEKQLVYLYVVQDKFDEHGTIIGDEWEKYFRVHYIVDDNMWLDDVEVREVSKEEIDKLLDEVKKS